MGNMIFAEEKEKEENIWKRKVFFVDEEEKEENIWRGKIYFLRKRRQTEKEKEENICVRQQKMSTRRRTKHFTTLCTDWVHVDPKLGLLKD